MAINDFNLGLIGKLNGTKSKHQLNNDIEALKKQLNSVEITAKLDPKVLGSIQIQLQDLQLQLNNVTVSQSALNGLVSQINSVLQHEIQISGVNLGNIGNQAHQMGQQIGQQINQGVSQSLSGNTGVLDTFRRSLQNIGMGSEEIDAVANRIENLGVKIESLNQSTSHTVGRRGNRDILSVDISGTDRLGQAIKLTERYNMATGDLIRSVDAVSTATQKENTQLENLSAQQIKRQQDLRNQISQIYNSAIDPNTSRSITDEGNLGQLRTQYNAIQTAINEMGSTSKTVFAEQEAHVTSLITTLKNSVSEYKNAENVRTSLKPDKLAEGISKAQSRWKALNADIQNSGVSSEKLSQEVSTITSALSRVDDGGILSKAEVERVHTALTNAKNELTALVKIDTSNSSLEAIRLQADTLKNKLDEFSKKNTGFADWTREVNGVTVSVETLKTELDGVRTASDLRVATARVNEFESAFKAVNATASKTNDITEKVNKIKLSIDNSAFSTQIEKMKSDFQRYGLSVDEAENKVKELRTTLSSMQNASSDDKLLSEFTTWQNQIKKTQVQLDKAKLSFDKFAQPVSGEKISSLVLRIDTCLAKNTKMTKEAKTQLEGFKTELNGGVTLGRWNEINTSFEQTENSMRKLHKLGASLKDQMRQATTSFTQWISISSAIMGVTYKVKEAFSTMKDMDTILTEISKTSDLTKTQLEDLGQSSYDSASKYGRTATDYLTGIQEMSRSGFYGKQGEAMAEQSLLAQTAGDMDADLANSFVLATNAAYKFEGEASKINAVIDGMNSITNKNSVAMTDMATAMTEAGTTASSYNVSIKDLSAMIGTMESVTKLGGAEIGNGIKSLLINLQNVSSSKITDTLSEAGASMTEFVNGTEQLRNPIEILRDLAKTFNTLDEQDPLRAKILTNIGGKYQATKLAALLQNMSMFDKQLQDYSEGSGSSMREAEKTADSLEGRINSLNNSWVKLVDSLANQDFIKELVSGFGSFLNILTSVTDKIGVLSTLGILGSGGASLFKNAGLCI